MTDAHGHFHGHSDHQADEIEEPKLDAANRSLADAFRVSFRLLSVIMVLVLAALPLTGLKCVHTGTRGVRLVFGRIQGQGDQRVLGEGLALAWPEPVGTVLTVNTQESRLPVSDFWMNEPPGEAGKKLSERAVTGEGLSPGLDGALLTGDRGLVHVRLSVLYSIARTENQPDPKAVLAYLTSTRDAAEVVRSVVSSAAIQAAATRTAESIATKKDAAFLADILRLAQQRLKSLRTGIRITAVNLENASVPLAARPAFDKASNAKTERQQKIDAAIGDATKILLDAAGASWKRLTSDADTPGAPGLLEQYARLRQSGDEKAAETLLRQINQVLLSNETTGAAARIINEGRTYSAGVRQQAERRATRFLELNARYNETPELLLQRLWAAVKEQILTSPAVEKFYLSPGQKLVFRIGRDPKVQQQIETEALSVKKGQTAGR